MITAHTRVIDDDIDDGVLDAALRVGVVGCDIETTGLDWRLERIGTFQLSVGQEAFIVRQQGKRPVRLTHLLEANDIAKVFHHATFDLRFLRWHWNVIAREIRCTKIAAKIVEPGLDSESYSLKSLVHRKLGVHIDKGERLSDWTTALTSRQVAYAANDVVYLVPLWSRLEADARASSRVSLIARTLEYLNTRVELDILGTGDPFIY